MDGLCADIFFREPTLSRLRDTVHQVPLELRKGKVGVVACGLRQVKGEQSF